MRSSRLQALPDDAREVLAQHRLGGGEDHRLDPAHPFAPARRRRQVFELAVEFASGFRRRAIAQSP